MAEHPFDAETFAKLYPDFFEIARRLKVSKYSIDRIIGEDILPMGKYYRVSEHTGDLSSTVGELTDGSILVASYGGLGICDSFIKHEGSWYVYDSQWKLTQVEIKVFDEGGLKVLSDGAWSGYALFAILIPVET